ncbi:MAG TPA: hypothetical protein VMV03_08795 [Spirochaetia bacterium]|nr:hypothetical protein [Spirochaetia bacterium]
MTCSNHRTIESVTTCAACGKPFCAECVVELEGRSWCRSCLSRMVKGSGALPGRSGWRKLVAALLSLIPGAGHMFLGLIGKGFALMSLLIVSIFLIILYSDATGMYWITAYLVPTLCLLWVCYAVFDAMAIADARAAGKTLESTDDDTMKAVWERVLLNRVTGGWILLVAGVVGVLRWFSEPVSRLTSEVMNLSIPLTGLVIPVILLVIGILLLKKSRKK